MTDVDENSGGTFCVPGAHRDTRNPRGPTDGITVTAPIPGVSRTIIAGIWVAFFQECQQ